jgi:hypothetical protein
VGRIGQLLGTDRPVQLDLGSGQDRGHRYGRFGAAVRNEIRF